jgi:hypothetical protein
MAQIKKCKITANGHGIYTCSFYPRTLLHFLKKQILLESVIQRDRQTDRQTDRRSYLTPPSQKEEACFIDM